MTSGDNLVYTHTYKIYKNEKSKILLTKVKSSPLENIKTGFGTVPYHFMVGEQKY